MPSTIVVDTGNNPCFVRTTVFRRLALAVLVALAGVNAANAQPAQGDKVTPENLQSEGAIDHFTDHVHIWVEGGPSPFYAIGYGARAIDGHYVVFSTKQYPYVPVYDNRVSVIEVSQFESLFLKLDELEVFRLGNEASKAPFTLTYKIELGWGGRTHQFAVTGPELLDDPRHAQVIEVVREFVEGIVGPARFRDLVYKERELGILNLRTLPPCEVTIDGIPTGRTTPLFGFELAPGEHIAVLEALSMGVSRSIKFKIVKGESTDLNINIRK